MKIAIDETGGFSPKSNDYHFFSAVHLQSRDNNSALIFDRFNKWENDLPRSLKNHKGEINHIVLNDFDIDKVIGKAPFNPWENKEQFKLRMKKLSKN